VSTGEAVRQALIEQIASPVLWADCVAALVGQDCRAFLELGPGRVLSGLVQQIDPSLEVFAADSPSKLSGFAAARG
jgi:[acyl-carrier-protein] S-malonyltransferase